MSESTTWTWSVWQTYQLRYMALQNRQGNRGFMDGRLQRSQFSTFLCPPPCHFPVQQSGHFPGLLRHLSVLSFCTPNIDSGGMICSIGGKASFKGKASFQGKALFQSIPRLSDMVISSSEGSGDPPGSVGALSRSAAPSYAVVASIGIFWDPSAPSPSFDCSV